MKKAKLAASLIAVSMAATTLLTGCNKTNDNSNSTPGNTSPSGPDNSPAEGPKLEYKDGTELRMATGYNSPATGIAFDAETIAALQNEETAGTVKLANGKVYRAGDLKPTWQELENRLNVKFTSVYQGNKSAADEFKYWVEKMGEVDMVAGSAVVINEYGVKGTVVDLSQHLDKMPNFKKYLEDNPIVRLSILGSTMAPNAGAIYFSPYFDGVNDIERMPLMRTDWVEKLLNGTDPFTADKSDKTANPSYQPFMPTSGKVEVDIVKPDASGTAKVTKDYDKAGNIIKVMNDKGSMDGVEAVNTLRKYIDEAYGGYYKPENRADLFIGQDAAWDADEMVALLRCVVANSATLNSDGKKVYGLFSRENDNNQRRTDMLSLAGILFGARGMEASNYLYIGNDNKLHDARGEEATYVAIERMNAMQKEGLFHEDFVNGKANKTQDILKSDTGFMSYDYCQTQTAFNKNYLDYPTEMYRPVMVPVSLWFDGSKQDGVYMRFTESWRSVKTDGWAISAEGVKDNPDKLNAALALIDYAYSDAGQILMSYGPDDFIKTDANGKYVTFNFNGKEMPEIADATYEELWRDDRGAGSYTDYARKFLGSTLSFLKSQAFEVQCTHEAGKLGANMVSAAIRFGTIKHPELSLPSNPWYTRIPTVLPTTDTDNDDIKKFTNLTDNGWFGRSKNQNNMYDILIREGYGGKDAPTGISNSADAISTINGEWGLDTVLFIRNRAWEELYDFYKG